MAADSQQLVTIMTQLLKERARSERGAREEQERSKRGAREEREES